MILGRDGSPLPSVEFVGREGTRVPTRFSNAAGSSARNRAFCSGFPMLTRMYPGR